MDGQDLRKVTDNRSFNLFRWSPDGQWLAYTSFRTGVPTVYLRNVATGAEKESSVRRVEGPGGFSPDGVWLYAGVSQAGNSDIYRSGWSEAPRKRLRKGGGSSLPLAVPDGRGSPSSPTARFSPGLREDGRPPERRGFPADQLRHVAVLVPAGDRIAYTARSGGRLSS